MLKLAVQKLRNHPIASVRFLCPEKKQQFAAMVCNREPAINDVIGFMDGVSFALECDSDNLNQNAFYSGY